MNEIIEASHPGFIRVVSKVDAVNERHFLRRDVSHVDVDVENEIRDLLHANPSNVPDIEIAPVIIFTAAAGAHKLPGIDLLLLRGWNRHKDILAGSCKLFFEGGRNRLQATPLGVGRRLVALVVILEMDTQQRDALRLCISGAAENHRRDEPGD